MSLKALKKGFVKVNMAPPKKDSLIDRIDSFLEDRANKPLPYVQSPGHKPSNLGTDCVRKIYYHYYRTERDEPINAFLARIFDTGNYYEAMVLSWLIAMGEHIPYRNKTDGKIPISKFNGQPNPQFPVVIKDWRIPKGYIDNIAIIDGKLWLYEIKSKNSKKFEAMTRGPDKDHKVQITCYFKGFYQHLLDGDFAHIPELKGITEIEGVKVIYVEKNTSNIRVFSLSPEELLDTAMEIDEKLEVTHSYTDNKELPPMTKGDCKYCDFKKKCKNSWNEV